MTDAVRAVILGVVEGLTEFLPVSSTGHMILVLPWLNIRPPNADFPFWNDVFVIFIQLGAILAVLLYFWRRLWGLIFRPPGEAGRRWHEHILVKLMVAFLPAAVVGKLLDDWMEAHLMTPAVVAGALVVGGVAIILIELLVRRATINNVAAVTLRQAFLIGCAQCLALVPGTSRSASTIMGGLVLGLTPPAAAEFSFLLAIPTMFAAGFYKLLKHIRDIQPDQWIVLGLGFWVSFVVALVVVAGFMRFIQTHRFTPFAWYRIVLGAVVMVALYRGTL